MMTNFIGDSRVLDKRRHERLAKEIIFYFEVMPRGELSGEDPAEQAVLIDIGGGGLRFLSDDPLEKTTQLLIKLEFTGWKDTGGSWVYTKEGQDSGGLLLIGEVMWSAYSDSVPGKFEIGVCFSGRIQ